MGNKYLDALNYQGTIGTMHGLEQARQIVRQLGNADKQTVLKELRAAEQKATVATGRGLREAIRVIDNLR